MAHQIILGHIEKVSLPELGIDEVIAKIDTGAFSGALHCTDIVLENDGTTLSFNPIGREDLRTSTKDFQIFQVRSASGHTSKRVQIPIEIVVRGQSYKTIIGLTDRSDMGREMLIGRRFLRRHNMIVDVTINGEHDEEWKRVNL